MDDIPIGPCLLVSALARIMISKAVQLCVPKRRGQPDQSRFQCANHVGSDFLTDHEAAGEILQSKIFHLGNVASVLTDPTKQFRRSTFHRV